jgi:tetratricopeptide (TPR) repeat protein
VIDPEYAPPYAGIAMVYALLDNYGYRSLAETEQHAHRALERALMLDPRSDEAWAVRGMLLSQGPGAHRRRQESRAALERAIEINPNNAFAHLWLAGALLPDFEAGKAALRQAYNIDPLSPVIVYRRAMEALQERDEADLARFLGELEEVAPDWFMTWHAVGTAAMERGRVAEAALSMERSVALNPEYPGSVSMLALALEALGYRARAEALLEDALARIGGEDLRLQLASTRARAALNNADLSAALEIYRAAVDPLQERYGTHQAELAMLEISAGQATAAERRIRAALGLAPGEDPTSIEVDMLLDHLALTAALAAQGRQDDADRLGDNIRRFLIQMADQGLNFSTVPLAVGWVDHLAGRPGRLEAGLRASIQLGFRTPPLNLGWLLPLDYGSRELEALMAIMDDALDAERERYAAAKAKAGPAGLGSRLHDAGAEIVLESVKR